MKRSIGLAMANNRERSICVDVNLIAVNSDHEAGGANVKYISESRTAPAVKLPPAAVRTIVVAL